MKTGKCTVYSQYLAQLPIFLILTLCLVPCISADEYVGGIPLTTVQSGTVSGGLYVDAELPSWGSMDVTKTFASIPSVDDIEWARIYVVVYSGHMQNNNPGNATVSFDGSGDGTSWTVMGTETLDTPGGYTYPGEGGTGPITVNDHCNRVTSDYLMWYDVTSLIASQTPKARVVTEKTDGSSFDGRIKMVTLVVAYNDGDTDEVYYWVNQGHDVDSYLADDAGMPYSGQSIFDLGSLSGTIESATLTVNHLASTDGTYAWNGNQVPTDPSGGNSQGAFFGYNTWDLTSMVLPGDLNNLTYDRIVNYYKIPLAALEVRMESTPPGDLEVTFVNPVTGNVFAKEPNTVRITVKNNGANPSPPTTVRLTSSDGFDGSGDVPSIAAGQTTIVSVTDTTVRNLAGGTVTYTAMVDPDNLVLETNEENNEKSSTEKVVRYNGYKGARYWEGKSDLLTSRTFDLHGGLLFSSGNSAYRAGGVGGSGWSSYTVTWTGSDLPLPPGATVREVRLYVPYTWDDSQQVPDHFNLTFNGEVMAHEAHYTDQSNFGGYANHLYGLLAYNVTQWFDPAGNTALLSKDNIDTNVAMYGLTLAVVYEDSSASRKQVFLNEGFDILGADETQYGTTPEEATAYLPFSGMTISPEEASGAFLTTFVPSGNGPEGDLLWNGVTISNSVWDYGPLTGTQVAVDTRDVLTFLAGSRNEAGVRSTAGSTPVMAASHAFLVVEYPYTPPVAQFTANTTSGTAPLTVAFTDQSTGTITSYAWDFTNDGVVDSTDEDPVHTYPSAGTYTVNLTVTGPGGSDSEVKTNYITVTAPPVAPVAQFTANTTSGTAPLTVAFTDQSTGTITSYAWDFTNDGVVDSTSQNPVHNYPLAGTYTVNLTVTGPGGSDSEVKTNYITVTAPPVAPVAQFTANTTSGTAPLTVAFTDQSTGTITSYAWDFTNDGVVDSTDEDPVHTYPSAGTYTVNLTVTGPGGSDSEVKIDYIVVNEAGMPDLTVVSIIPNSGAGNDLFAAEPNDVMVSVGNSGTADAGAFTVSVDIGGAVQTVDVTGLAMGASTTVTVPDTVLRSGGESVTITATADSAGMVEESDETNNTASVQKTVYNNGYKGKRWTGGDDLTTQLSFDGRYGLLSSPGTTAYQGANWVETTAVWSASDLPVPPGATVVSARLYQGYAYNKMGTDPACTLSLNGVTVQPVATYKDRKGFGSFDYPYGLYVYDVTGSFNTTGNSMIIAPEAGNDYGIYGAYLVVVYEDPLESWKSIRINDGFDMIYSRASYSVNDTEATVYAPFAGIDTGGVERATMIAILASAADADKSAFFFNEQEYPGFWPDYLTAPQIGFSEYDVTGALVSGNNEARLQSRDPGSSGDNMYAMNCILVIEYEEPAPVARFTANTTSGTEPLTVAFTDQSTGTITSYAWDFTNDGVVDSTDEDPVHTYPSAGTYTVNLTVTGPGGSDSEVKTNYITVTAPPVAPVAQFTANTTSGTAPLTVAFTDQSTGTITSYAWDFTNDGVVDSTSQNPVHTYASAGTYTVNLTVTGPGGSDSEVKTGWITVSAGATGTLYVASVPSGAEIYIDGVLSGTTNQFVTDIPTGNRNITLVKSGYQTKTVWVDVPTGIKVLAPITLTPGGGPADTGTLYIASVPSGAEIYIDG
ncbi:MAG TPA: DUF3344 domain-containing protein, partial [Methanoregulaceae archaeon]|nr:DUF3344 domain-containing protein [Methanoregulaceae archaeon]